MAGTVRHSTRLLSPGENLLYALLPSTSRALPPRPRTQCLPCPHQQRRGMRKARELPSNFNINEVIREQANRSAYRLEKLLAKTETLLDEAIATRWVVVRREGGISQPQLLSAVIRSIDRQTHCVQLLSATGPQPDTAVVQVIPRDELLKALEEKLDRRKQHMEGLKATKNKQIELNWGIGEHDLANKLKQLEGFLNKGLKVELLFANKKRAKKATAEEAGAMVARTRKRVDEIGAEELKWEGMISRTATMTVEKKPAS